MALLELAPHGLAPPGEPNRMFAKPVAGVEARGADTLVLTVRT